MGCGSSVFAVHFETEKDSSKPPELTIIFKKGKNGNKNEAILCVYVDCLKSSLLTNVKMVQCKYAWRWSMYKSIAVC